jgi:hypothetical protein
MLLNNYSSTIISMFIHHKIREDVVSASPNTDHANPHTSLDREAFVRGMWRIDEELRRIRTKLMKTHSCLPVPMC